MMKHKFHIKKNILIGFVYLIIVTLPLRTKLSPVESHVSCMEYVKLPIGAG